MTILTDAFVQVIVSIIRTNIARCALYKEILDLLVKESVSGVLPRMFELVSRSLKYDFWSTNIYTYKHICGVHLGSNICLSNSITITNTEWKVKYKYKYIDK